MLPTHRHTFDFHLDEYDEERRIRVMDGEEFSAHRGHLDVELLKKLASRRVEVRLSFFELATRELPQSPVSLVQGPSADQIASAVLNDCGENTNGGVSQTCCR